MQTKTVDLKQAQAHFKDLIHSVELGKIIILNDNEKPVARILPIGKRISGLHVGTAVTSEDFDSPLPDNFWTGEK